MSQGTYTATNLPSDGETIDAADVNTDLQGLIDEFNKQVGPTKLADGAVISTKFGMPGQIVMYGSNNAPTGWFICDGTAISRTTYAALFAIIGTSFGSGDGSTTFNLPNLKGRVPVGRDAAQTEFDVLGETGGAKTHTLSNSQIPSGVALISGTHGAPGGVTSLSVISNSSGGNAHNNLQPYIAVNFIIKT